MATRQEIIDTIDAFLEDRITLKEAIEWAQKESTRTPHREDPSSTLLTFIGSALFEDAIERSLKEQLLLDREVLVHGVPCPEEELGKTVEAFWLAYTPWEKIVLCQVKTMEGEKRILEVTEEGWDGTLLFHEDTSIPLRNGNSQDLMWEEIERKRDACCSGKITEEEFLCWILDQLQRENALHEYESLLFEYWRARRKDYLFTLEYVEGKNKSGKAPEALLKLVKSIKKKEEERSHPADAET